MREWSPDRIYHRQMYVDLVRAYLREFGSQRELARVTGLHEVSLSRWLEPTRLETYRRSDMYWGDLITSPIDSFAKGTTDVQMISLVRIKAMVGALTSDEDRQSTLLWHIERERERLMSRGDDGWQTEDDMKAAMSRLGHRHGEALSSSDSRLVAAAFADVWAEATQIAQRIDPRRYPLEVTQVLLYLDDAAATFNRSDLALGYARKALLVLSQNKPGAHEHGHLWHRFWINAVAAEARALHVLGLDRDVERLANRAKSFDGYRIEPESWERTILEQQLNAMASERPVRIYAAEAIADRLHMLSEPNPAFEGTLRSKMVSIYVSRGTKRSVRKAEMQVSEFLRLAVNGGDISPLRRVSLLRSAARYYHHIGDQKTRNDLVALALSLSELGYFLHQRAEIAREYPELAVRS